MKKLITFALFAIMALSLVACGNSNGSQGDPTEIATSQTPGQSVQIPNPYIDCESLEDAAKLAGFDIIVPDSIDSYDERIIRASENKMIEVIYSNDEQEVRIRKAVGTEDISGDFNEYAENNKVDLGLLQINMRGSDSKINIATWTDNNYTFALSIGDGMTTDEVLALVETVQ